MRGVWIVLLVASCLPLACFVEQAPSESDGDDVEETAAPGACALHTDCAPDERCRFSAGSCGAELGICEAVGLAMADTVAACSAGPVCGCDGRDYLDDCAAWNGGVSVWFDGSCADGAPPVTQEPQTTSPTCPGGCAPGSFCFSDDGTCGGGRCQVSAGACTGSANPVCGCDGVTYDSTCDAIRNEASIDHLGGC